MKLKRREFITLLGGAAAAWPLAARAQQDGRVRRIGMLKSGGESDPGDQALIAAFVQGMQVAGWTDGRNVRFDIRSPGADPERMRAEAAQMVASAPDAIVTTSTLMTTFVSQHTRTIPIVIAGAGDAPSVGIVGSMARPEGNITGFTSYELSLGGKWLQLLKDVAPRITRVAAVYTPGGPSSEGALRIVETAASSLGVQTTSIAATTAAEIERALAMFAREADGGLMVLPGPSTIAHRELLVMLALRHRLPAIYTRRVSVLLGGMMCYTADVIDLYRRTASYVDRILRGAKPGDLPIQAPTKYELVVNVKTARAIGLVIPEIFLVRADEVIE